MSFLNYTGSISWNTSNYFQNISTSLQITISCCKAPDSAILHSKHFLRRLVSADLLLLSKRLFSLFSSVLIFLMCLSTLSSRRIISADMLLLSKCLLKLFSSVLIFLFCLSPLFSSYHQRWFVLVVSVLSNNILTAQRHRGLVDKRQKDVSWEEMVEGITALCLVIGQCWWQLQNINTNRNSRFWTVEALCSQKIMITRIETKTQNTKRQKDNAWKKKWSAACLAS